MLINNRYLAKLLGGEMYVQTLTELIAKIGCFAEANKRKWKTVYYLLYKQKRREVVVYLSPQKWR